MSDFFSCVIAALAYGALRAHAGTGARGMLAAALQAHPGEAGYGELRDEFHDRLDFTIERLMEHLGIEDYVANRLEFVNGYATGRVLPPVMASATKAKWIREYAEREDINLSDSYAYSDSISDLPMLSIVGHPVAVCPDFRLKQTALQHDWAVIDLK